MMYMVNPRTPMSDFEVDAIVADVFGGVSKGGDGFVIINGKFRRVPPRGIKNVLLGAIVDIAEAEALDAAASAKRKAAIRVTIEKAMQTF